MTTGGTEAARREAWRTMQRLMFDGEAHDCIGKAFATVGLPPGAVKALIHLAAEPIPMRDIAAHFGVDASYVTSLVDDLETHGLAERGPHPTDRRVKTVALTPKGVEVQRSVYELMWDPPQCFGALTATEQRQLLGLLNKLVAADQRLSGGPAPPHPRPHSHTGQIDESA